MYSSVLLSEVLGSLLKTIIVLHHLYLPHPSSPNVISPWPSRGLREDMENICIMHIAIIVHQVGGGILDEPRGGQEDYFHPPSVYASDSHGKKNT